MRFEDIRGMRVDDGGVMRIDEVVDSVTEPSGLAKQLAPCPARHSRVRGAGCSIY